MQDLHLSKNFWLSEFTKRQTAVRRKIDNIPNDIVVRNLKILCVDFLQPLRDRVDCPIVISSGYRSKLLNKFVGGSVNSRHILGCAVDFTIPGMTLRQVVNLIKKEMQYDQLILEFNSWIHVSYSKVGNRNHFLTIE